MEKNLNYKCPLCNGGDITIIYSNYPGYIDGSKFEIFKCTQCTSHFVVNSDDLKKMYDIIYSSTNTNGYDRYYRYATQVKDMNDPLKFLALNESTYFPIYNYVQNKKQLNILEVGCGYGYLTYALHKRGFNAKGIDIASTPISFAKESFGDFYFNITLDDFVKQTDIKFDLIIATELIEHLIDPNEFLNNCIKILKKDSKIIITTPNKDFYKPNSIWQTDYPPVHLTWISKKGLEFLAKKNGFRISFFDFSKYYSQNVNRLYSYMSTRKEQIKNSPLTKAGFPILEFPSLISRVNFYLFNKVSLIRLPSNFLYNLFYGDDITLSCQLAFKDNQSENSISKKIVKS